MNAAIYARISRDIEGTSRGVERQKKLCREIVKREGWEVVETYVDNDVSATGRKPRPGYRQMLQAAADGAFDVIVALDSDRLLRKPGELEALFELCEAKGIRVRYQSGGFDPVTGDGMFDARIRAVVDAEEVAKLKKRVKRKALEIAEAGKLGGGGTRPFGFEPDRVTIRESEAVHIRKAVDEVLAGASVRSITMKWNRDGVLTPSGKTWAQSVVRRMLTSARIAGLRAHQGEVVAKACWPAIVEEADWRQLVDKLSDPERLKRRQPARRYLLRGFLYSSTGEKMIARPRGDKSRSYFAPGFRCLAEPIEDEVVERVLDALDTDALGKLLAADRKGAAKTDRGRTLTTELAKVERLIEKAYDDYYVAGELDERTYEKILRAQQERRAELELKLAAMPTRKLPRDFPKTGAALRTWWTEVATMDDQRLVMAAVVDRVVLKPALVGRNFFDPDRVAVKWRA